MSLELPSEITLEFVQSLEEHVLHECTMKYLVLLKKKRQWNKEYNQTPRVQTKQRSYYYKKNNIYHPTYNQEGEIEKRHKKSS